ncbi:MAG: tetratricopeptide repeat protein [Deltaproteobacteria bacterium]|nr:tetratricopeptide repeat protein [Deltaproteobacteria bacterium]
MKLLPKALAALVAMPLGACATANAPSRDEVEALRGEVAALRSRQADQDRELAKLRSQLDDRGAQASAAAPVAATSATTRAAASTTTNAPSAAPQVPDNLKVVYVAPDPVILDDHPTHAAREAPASRRRGPPPTPAPAPPTTTELREPIAADDAGGLSPEALEVAYKAALAAPDSGGALERFAHDHPQAAQADNALFEAGVHAERAGQSERAAHDFERVVKEHPAGDVVADALLHLAGCQLQLHQTLAAKQTLSRITSQFPGSAQAEAAQSRLTDLGG